ncbi:MAG: S8 family serine peptidase [Anaerolineales bacterium]|nr:S8 family serine peptidase [Anaerolineales bacterium]
MCKRLFGSIILLILFLLPTSVALAQAPAPDDGTIYLQAGAFDPLSQPAVATAGVDAPPSPYYLVQFTGPVEEMWLEQVAALGGAVVGYVPNDTHIVRMTPATMAAVRSLPSVRWVGPFQPAYKVAPELTEASLAVGAAASDPLELTVIAFPGESPAALDAFLTAQGAVIVEAANTPIGPVLRVQASLAMLPALSQHPAVSWVERYIQPTITNDQGRKLMGAEAVWESFGYYGAGQIVAISDSGLSVQGALSGDFAGRLVRAFAPSEMNLASAACTAKTTYTDLNGHGTHVAGSVLGNGARSGSNAAGHAYTSSHAGTAPEASLVFMALNTDGSGGIQCIDLNGDFIAKGYQEGARVSSNSWGASNGGAYSQLSSLVDDYIWRHKDYLVLFAAGNSGPGAQTIGAPATAKNVLTIGASENNRPDIDDMADDPNSMASFSSRGPTADGRIKPEVVAPGTWVLSVRAAQAPDGSFWGNFNQDYAFMGGTSMATPLAAGGAAIVREWLNKARGLATPSAALLKALIVNGATQLAGEGLASNNSGYGRIDLKNTLNANYGIMDDHVQGLQTNDVVTYTVQIVAAGGQGLLIAQGGPAQAASASGALQMTAETPLVAASVAITTPDELRGEALPGFDQARPLTRIPDADNNGKTNLTPLPNVAPTPGGGQPWQAEPATTDRFRPGGGNQGLSLQNFQQHMVGGGDFEDPEWTDIWSEIWLGGGIPVRTSNPNFVVSDNYSMWLGGTPVNDALFYPVQFPDTIDSVLASGIAFNVRVVDEDIGFDNFCVALIDASGYFLGPYAPNNPDCFDQNGSWKYERIFDATDLAALAGETAYLVVFTDGDGVLPHMSAFVDDIVLVVDFPTPTAAITPAVGPPGTTFLLTGKYNVPYGWVDICISPCTIDDNYITTVYADAAGSIAAFLYSSTSIAPGPYAIQTSNLAGRTAESILTISGAAQPTLAVAPASGAAGTSFSFSGSNFLPGDQAIAVTVNGESAGSVGSNNAGAITFSLDTATNTPAGSYTVRATDSAGRSAAATFAVTAVAVGEPKLTVTPASGPPSTTFTFVASNFTASSPATVSLDGQALGQVNIDAAGMVTLTLETRSDTAPAKYTLTVAQGAKNAAAQYEVTAGGGAPVSGAGLYVTLAWSDPPAQTAASQTLVNDLDLFVDGPGGRVFANGGNAADRKNNVEAVRIETPAAGTYIITVRAQRVNASFGTQPFALVATSKQNFGAGQNSVELGQTNAGALSGVFFADVNRNGVRDAGEPGIAGASVVVRQTSGALSRQTTTNASGVYQAANLPAGDYSITVLPPPGYTLTTAATASKSVVAGDNSAPAIGAVLTLHLPAVRR